MKMASIPPGEDANSLDDQQWRQMRRQMPCLQFDPVPETPPLLPRSLYSDEEVEGEEASSPIEIASEPSVGRALVLEDLTCHPPSLVETPIFSVGPLPIHTHSVSTMIANESMATLLTSSKPSTTTQVPMKTVKADPPSSAITETPPLTTVTVPEEDELSFDLNTLATQIADAQDTLRHAMMAAVAAAMTQMRREADLEQRKRDAAHANVVAMLETRVDELTERLRSREKRDHQDSAVLERFSQHVARCRQRERERWCTPHSLRACFNAWRVRVLHKQQKKIQQHVAKQFMRKHSQQILLQQWKLLTQTSQHEKNVQRLQDGHHAALETLKVEYDERIERLERELETAKRETAVAQQARQQMEDDLRQVFLRGVSAMNIEALTLFKANHNVSRQHGTTTDDGDEEAMLNIPTDQDEQDSKAIIVNAQAAGEDVSGTQGAVEEDRRVPQVTEPAPVEPGSAVAEAELPYDERMIPVRQPRDSHDLHAKLQTLLPSAATRHRLTRSASTLSSSLSSSSSMNMAAPPPVPSAPIHGLRSAELVEAHQRMLHATTSTRRPSTAGAIRQRSMTAATLSPTKNRARLQSSTKYHVEMEFMRSSVATSAMLNARYGASDTTNTSSRRPPTNTRNVSSERQARASLSSSSGSIRRCSGF